MVKKMTNYRKQQLYFIIVFIIISFLMVLPLWVTHRLVIFSDFSFHASRVEEIARNLSNGQIFTFIATKTFHHTGVASFLFYPSIFLYPWAVFSLFLNPINSFYLWYLLMTITTFCVAYFCMLSFSNNQMQSFIFSLIYTVVPYRLYLGTSVFGEFIAFSFLPIVFLGIYKIFWGGEQPLWWSTLSVGMALVGYAHILSVILCCEFLIIIILYYLFTQEISKSRLIGFFKSIGLTLILVSFELIPFIQSFRKIYSPNQGIGIKTSFTELITSSLQNVESNSAIGFILLLTLFVGLVLITDKQYKFIYFLGLGSCILATSLFPWSLFDKTPLAVIQLTFRYLAYASLFLAIVSSKILVNVLNGKRQFLTVIGISVFTVLFGISALGGKLHTLKEYNTQNMITKTNEYPIEQLPLITVVDKNNYANMFNYSVVFGENDYYPLKAVGAENKNNKRLKSIENTVVFVNGKRVKNLPKYSSNLISYRMSLENNAQVNLPTLCYRGTYVKVNGKTESYKSSSRGTVLIGLKKGVNKVEIGYQPWKIYYVALLASIIGWSLLIYLRIK
ncbi:hypothetical protein G5T19_01340 [Lactobacillus reuteri]|nr:hypothetical protein [Limosilactobacillus reuteri]